MRLLSLPLLFVGMLGVCQAETPPFVEEKQLDPASFAQAVNYYVVLGRGPAVRELSKLAREHERPVSWLCRVLFLPKEAGQTLREPEFGALIDLPQAYPTDTMPSQSWPLYPVAVSGKSYFVLGTRYVVAGLPEDPENYVSYCRWHGRFRTDLVPVPTHAEAQQNALALHHSPAWKAVRWSFHDANCSYDCESEAWNFIQAQANAVPTMRPAQQQL